MPRVWQPRYGVSPFADLLVQRMLEHEPPLKPHQVAKYLGVDQAVVSNWLNRGSIPGAPVSKLLAELFHDTPEVWDRAAGRSTPQIRPGKASPITPEGWWDALFEQIEAMPWSNDEKLEYMERTLQVQSRLEGYEMPTSFQAAHDAWMKANEENPELTRTDRQRLENEYQNELHSAIQTYLRHQGKWRA